MCNLTKLSVLVDEWVYIENFMKELTSLLELELTVIIGDNLRWYNSESVWTNMPVLCSEEDYQDYIQSLQYVVSATTAHTLKLIVVKHPYRPIKLAFENKFVEYLTVEGPCSFCVLPVMENLKELRVKVTTAACPYGPQHSAGVCGVELLRRTEVVYKLYLEMS